MIDLRQTDLVKIAHVEADGHLPLRPGTNVAMLAALAHVIVTEGLVDEAFVRERCDWNEFQDWAAFVARPSTARGAEADHRRRRRATARRGRLYATGGTARSTTAWA